MTDTPELDEPINHHSKGAIDLELERSGILASYADFIVAGRETHPSVVLYWGSERVLQVTSRSWQNPDDFNRAMTEMMYIYPAIDATTAILTFPNKVKLVDRLADCLVVASITTRGVVAGVFPYRVEDGLCHYDMEAEIDPAGGGAFSNFTVNLIPVFAQIAKSPFKPSDVLPFLEHMGHEIRIFDGYSEDVLDAKSGW